jgi:hypothetical protein
MSDSPLQRIIYIVVAAAILWFMSYSLPPSTLCHVSNYYTSDCF